MREPQAMASRRNVLRGGLAAAAAMAFLSPTAFAEQLALTPPVEEGPFYPPKLPLDTDNDLIIINNSITPAIGQIAHLGGRILDASGSPIRNAVVEIWQCDANSVYLAQAEEPNRDGNFQGYGRFLTGMSGEYYFRTIKPVPYSGRPAPHIHMKIRQGRSKLLTTQVFIAGYPSNTRDGVYMGISDPVDRELASAEFKALKESKINECTARFDVVLGRTPADREHQHDHV
jgi:protocatechuate 3,4-dioxygenase beta subunit